jgi:hemerythrin-like domain-containing protein
LAAQIRQAVADFDHPLQMLTACHDRIRAQCETLRKLAVHLPVHGCDAQAQQAASNVMRYFDSAGRHHREDEEEDLFPLMIAAARGENAERLALLIDKLHREHRELEEAWLKLRETLELIAHGEHAPLDELEVGRFCGMYQVHVVGEEANMLPLAEKILTPEEIAVLGRGMRQRRGMP